MMKRIVAIDNTSRYVVEDADPSLKKKSKKKCGETRDSAISACFFLYTLSCLPASSPLPPLSLSFLRDYIT